MTVACAGKMYAVHKLVLSSCSDYFSAILQATNCPQPVIVLKDISSCDFEALLSFMYLGEVNIRQDKLASLLQASESLGVRGLALPENSAMAECVLEDPSSAVLSPHIGCTPEITVQNKNSEVGGNRENLSIPDNFLESATPIPTVENSSQVQSSPKRKVIEDNSLLPFTSITPDELDACEDQRTEKNKKLKPSTPDHQKDNSNAASDDCSLNTDIGDLCDDPAFEGMVRNSSLFSVLIKY